MNRTLLLAIAAVCVAAVAQAQSIPLMVNYQGKVEVSGVPFTGVGWFKFAITDLDGTEYYWTNDGSMPTPPDAPSNAVLRNVSGGLYSVNLGDASLDYMTRIPPDTFESPDRVLRVWFDDGVNGEQVLTPDKQLVSAPYAYQAEHVSPNARIPSFQTSNRSFAEVSLYGHISSGGLWAEFGNRDTGVYNTGSNYFVIKDIICTGAGDCSVDDPAHIRIEYDQNGQGNIEAFRAEKRLAKSDRFSFEAGVVIPQQSVIKFTTEGGTLGACDVTLSGYETRATNIWSVNVNGQNNVPVTARSIPADEHVVITDALLARSDCLMVLSETANPMALLALRSPGGATFETARLASFFAGIPASGPTDLQATFSHPIVTRLTLAGYSSNWAGAENLGDFQLTITTDGTGTGSVTASPPGPYYLNDAVTLIPQPAAGSHFVRWTGGETGSDVPGEVIMSENKSVNATFDLDEYDVSITVVGQGIVQRSSDPPYHYGDEITLTALELPGYAFSGWSEGLTGNENPKTFNIYANMSVTATFTERWYANYNFAVKDVVAYWPLDGNLYDLSGNGHEGTIVPNVDEAQGKFYEAYQFSGGCISVPYGADLKFDARTEQYTVSMFFKYSAAGTQPLLRSRK